jgi:hypothetical protein
LAKNDCVSIDISFITFFISIQHIFEILRLPNGLHRYLELRCSFLNFLTQILQIFSHKISLNFGIIQRWFTVQIQHSLQFGGLLCFPNIIVSPRILRPIECNYRRRLIAPPEPLITHNLNRHILLHNLIDKPIPVPRYMHARKRHHFRV